MIRLNSNPLSRPRHFTNATVQDYYMELIEEFWGKHKKVRW